MKFEEIQKLWSSDCDIDETELSQESVKIPQLHNKYLIYFHDERLRLRTMNFEYNKLLKLKTISVTRESLLTILFICYC